FILCPEISVYRYTQVMPSFPVKHENKFIGLFSCGILSVVVEYLFLMTFIVVGVWYWFSKIPDLA
ncbi:MAG: hypothetical protein ACKVG1_15160, partial [Rhodospirillales bacterium]